MDNLQSLEAGLPRRDRQITAALIAAMALADLVFAAFHPDVARRLWPLFFIMPGTLAVVWFCYAASLHFIRRKHAQVSVVGRFMGATMVAAGSVMLFAQGGLLANLAKWFNDFDVVLRLFMAGFSIVLVVVYDRMPKLLGAAAGPLGAKLMFVNGRVGMICCAGMVVAAAAAPWPYLTPVYLTLAFTPTLVLGGNYLIVWLDRRRLNRPS